MDLMDCASGYCLGLSDGKGWQIIAASGLKPWLDKLAFIMELETGQDNPNNYPRLIFAPNSFEKEIRGKVPRFPLPQDGWNIYDFQALRAWLHPDVPDVFCEMGLEGDHNLDILRMSLSFYPVYHRAQDSGGLPFHAALVERNGIGVLLAAQGNTGKSTCCRRIPPPWQALCDDETLVVRSDSKGYHAHPFPTWSDYLFRRSKRTWHVERHVPLAAIFFLEQADADEVLPLGQGEAAVRVLQSAMEIWTGECIHLNTKENKALRKTCFENACEIALAIPAYLLHVSLFGSFWEEMEKVLP